MGFLTPTLGDEKVPQCLEFPSPPRSLCFRQLAGSHLFVLFCMLLWWLSFFHCSLLFFLFYLKTSSNFTENTQFLLNFAFDSWKWVPGAYLAIDRQWQQWWGGRWVGRDSCHHRVCCCCCCARHCCCCLDECCCRPGRNSEIIALSGVLYGHNSWVLGSNRANYGRSVSPLGAHHYSNYIQRVRIIVRGNCKFVQSMCWTYLK